jgi:hypothetical protein
MGANNFDQQKDVDAYLDAFISGAGSANSEANPTKTGQEWLAQGNQQSPPLHAESPSRLDEPPGLKELNSVRDELQQLRRFLGETQARNQVRQSPPPSNGRLKQGIRFIKTLVLILGVSFTSTKLYEYYQSCARTDNCLWDQIVIAQSERVNQSPQPAESQTPQTPQVLPSDPFKEAVKQATNAVELAKTARSREDWNIVVEHWLESIKLMNSVHQSNTKFELAQQKAGEYIGYLTYAQQEAELAASREQSDASDPSSELVCPTQGK